MADGFGAERASGDDRHEVAVLALPHVVAGAVLRPEPVRHGRIFAHVGFRATGFLSVGFATLER